jgi:hypothetical protein
MIFFLIFNLNIKKMADNKVTLKRVNNIKVKPIPRQTNKDYIRSSIVNNPNNITLLVSKKKSGKTTALTEIIKNHIAHYPLQKINTADKSNSCVTVFGQDKDDPNKPRYHRNLTVIVFCGTVNNDDIWDNIIEILNRARLKSILVETSTYDETKINLVEQLVQHLKIITANVKDDDDEHDLMKPIPEPGDFLIIFDDLSDEFKQNKSITKLFKNMRHFRIINILCCSQSALDFSRDMFDNADHLLVFKKMPIDRLQHVYNRSSLGIDWKTFYNLYHKAADPDNESKHNFFMIDKNNDEYYKNFDLQFEL